MVGRRYVLGLEELARVSRGSHDGWMVMELGD